MIAPLLPAEDADQADGDADDDGYTVLAQPLLHHFALFVVVVCVKCHAVTVEKAAVAASSPTDAPRSVWNVFDETAHPLPTRAINGEA